MLIIYMRCMKSGCSEQFPVTVKSKHYFNGLPLKQYIPKGWRIRMPKNQDCQAYCPRHADSPRPHTFISMPGEGAPDEDGAS